MWPVVLPLEDPILQFTLLVTAALVMRVAAQRVHLPGLLGLLLFGMLFGPDGFGVLPADPVVSLLGQVGLIYVMFVAGLEIDVDVVREHRQEAVLFGALAFASSAIPAVGSGRLLGFGWPSAVLLGALISSHTLIAYPALLRLGLHRQVPVVTAVGGTLITDTLALATLAIVLSLSAPDATILGSLLPLALLGAIAALAFTLIPRLSRRFFRREGTSAAEHALFALAVLLVLAVATELAGTDRILGAFLAGITLNRPLAERRQLREHIEFVGRMLFIPFFFIWTGTLLDLDVLTGDRGVWLLAGLLVTLVLIGKSVAAWTVGAVHGYDRRSRVLMAGLTVPQAAATLAIAITAFQEGLFDATLIDAVIILILVTCVVGPIVTVHIGRRLRRGREREARDEPVHPQVDEPRGV